MTINECPIISELSSANQLGETVSDPVSSKISDLYKACLPKNENSPNIAPIDSIARVVMRLPHPKAIEMLCQLHHAIGSKFANQSSEGLLWLLGGSPLARGGFKDVANLRAFLAKDPKTISPSRLITGIETLLTAIAYRGILAPWAEKPIIPETEQQQEMALLCNGVRKKLVLDISQNYPDRRNYRVDVDGKFDPNSEFLGDRRDELSDGSDLEEDLKPCARGPRLIFEKRKLLTTWAYAAKEGNVPVGGPTSGTASLALAAADWLLADTDLFQSQENVEIFTGAVLIPTYLRADYHVVAETFAGHDHYVNSHFNHDEQSFVSPYQALEGGLQLLNRGVKEEFQAAVAELNQRILLGARSVLYTPNNPLYSEAIQYAMTHASLILIRLMFSNPIVCASIPRQQFIDSLHQIQGMIDADVLEKFLACQNTRKLISNKLVFAIVSREHCFNILRSFLNDEGRRATISEQDLSECIESSPDEAMLRIFLEYPDLRDKIAHR